MHKMVLAIYIDLSCPHAEMSDGQIATRRTGLFANVCELCDIVWSNFQEACGE